MSRQDERGAGAEPEPSGPGPRSAAGRALVAGAARGRALVLSEPLSFWGGVEADSGRIVDRRHPQRGAVVTDRILVMPYGRGSSSSSSVLAEALRCGTGPAGILLREPDPILVLGVLVAGRLYGSVCPVVVVDEDVHRSVPEGGEVAIDRMGGVTVRGNRSGREERGAGPGR